MEEVDRAIGRRTENKLMQPWQRILGWTLFVVLVVVVLAATPYFIVS